MEEARVKTGAVAFPYDALPKVERAALDADHAARALAHASLDARAFSRELTTMIGADVALSTRLPQKVTAPSDDIAGLGLGFVVHGGEAPLRLVLECERALAVDAVSRALARPASAWTSHASTSPSEDLCGATAGLVATALRRSAREASVRVMLATSASRATQEAFLDAGFAWVWSFLVRLGDAKYAARVWVPASSSLAARPEGAGPALHAIDLAASAVAGLLRPVLACFCEVAFTAEDLAALVVGDFVSVPALVADARGVLTAARAGLCEARSERGLAAEIRGGTVRCLGEAAVFGWSIEDAEMSESQNKNDTTDVISSVPLVGRVELGQVEMSVTEWSNLERGAVVLTGARVADAVTLRVSGAPVARGELVVCDGEVGVRITELVK